MFVCPLAMWAASWCVRMLAGCRQRLFARVGGSGLRVLAVGRSSGDDSGLARASRRETELSYSHRPRGVPRCVRQVVFGLLCRCVYSGRFAARQHSEGSDCTGGPSTRASDLHSGRVWSDGRHYPVRSVTFALPQRSRHGRGVGVLRAFCRSAAAPCGAVAWALAALSLQRIRREAWRRSSQYTLPNWSGDGRSGAIRTLHALAEWGVGMSLALAIRLRGRCSGSYTDSIDPVLGRVATHAAALP